MTTYVLDMNDSELRIARMGADTTDVVAQSNGFAIIDERNIRFGDAAMQQFRLHPRQVNNHYWNRMNTDPLAVRGPNTANHADLVYRHLADLVREAAIAAGDDFVIATPGTTSNEQLGLLLGITAEAGVTVAGLVDAALAASALHGTPKRAVHVDVFLHRAVVTELTKAEGLARSRVDEVAELGLANLSDAWVNVIADRFVRDARFDPLSIAAADQQLYNQLHAWLADLARPKEFGVDVDLRGSLRHADLSVDALISKGIAALPHARPIHRRDGGAAVASRRSPAGPGGARRIERGARRIARPHGSVPRHCNASAADPIGSVCAAAGHPAARASGPGIRTRSSATAHRASTAAGAPHTRSVR